MGDSPEIVRGWSLIRPFDIGVEETLRYVAGYLPPTTLRILDAGCGRGALAAGLRLSGHCVTAIDKSSRSVEMAREYGTEVLLGDVLSFEASEPFDAVIFSRSIHHVSPLNSAIDRAKGLLKPGGLLILEEFAVNRMDHRTARWFYETDLLLVTAGILKSDSKQEPVDSDALARWRAEHREEPPLNTDEQMFDAVKKHMKILHRSDAPYLYRYWLSRLPENDLGCRVATRLARMEESLIRGDVLSPLGMRVVGRRDP